MVKRRKHARKQRFLTAFYSIALIGIIALLSVAVIKLTDNEPKIDNPTVSTQTASKPKEPPFKETEATVLSTGDIMVHNPQLDGGYVKETGLYDFSAFFKEAASYFKKADIGVGNLEVTFGGNEGRKYSGYPAFNTPDVLADNMKNAGFNLFLTSNNHSYDTGFSGLVRTAKVLKEKGVDFTGTKETEADPSYIIKTVNNINIGFINYTYETSSASSPAGVKYLNGMQLKTEANSLVNSFNYYKIEQFYTDISAKLNEMKEKGSEYNVVYMHWGNEYQTSPNTHQKSIAQRLCNMGFDMIIGSHPHVIQPIELINSEDSNHTAVCVYSMGNAVSNQRQEILTVECPTGHTEDGMLFEFTLKKTKEGVALSSLDLIPTWVNKYKGGSGYQYTIYPLEDITFADKYGLDATAASKARRSFERTKKIVAEGLTRCQQSIGCEITFSENQEG